MAKKLFPKDLVRQAFNEGGEAAARKMADKLAKEGTGGGTDGKRTLSEVDRWLREWGATSPTPSSVKPASEPRTKTAKAEKTPPKPEGKRDTGKRRVYDVGEPNVHGTVLTAGEQVSVVRWDVSVPWGKECNVSNEQLKDVESEPTEKDKRVFFNAADFSVIRPNALVKKNPKGKGTHREDETVSTHKTFKQAIAAASDEALWVFARTKGGTVALLMRPHWDQYLRLEQARKEDAA